MTELPPPFLADKTFCDEARALLRQEREDLELQIAAIRQELADFVRRMDTARSAGSTRAAQAIADGLATCAAEPDARVCLRSLQILRGKARQMQGVDEVARIDLDRQRRSEELQRQIAAVRLEIESIARGLEATRSPTAVRSAKLIDERLAVCLQATDAAACLRSLQALHAQARQWQGADEVAMASSEEKVVYDALADFCLSWHGNVDIDRIADEAWHLFNCQPEERVPDLLSRLRALSEAGKKAIVSVLCNQLLKADPLEAEKVADLKQKILSLSSLAEVHRRLQSILELLQKLKSGGAARAAQALEVVRQADLASLRPADRIDLLSKLRLAIPNDQDEQDAREKELRPYFEAMARLYEATPLLPEFADTQKAKREAVLAALGNDPALVRMSENWEAWSRDDDGKAEKLQALHYVVAAQSKLMGFASVPEIVPDTMDKFVFEGADGTRFEQFDQGNFSSMDRVIRVNDHPESTFSTSFYKSLITMLHENTHSYQNQLVDELKAGTLTEASNKQYYEQALLFLLNEDVGYLPPGDAYEEQPVERHAHEVEDEAAEVFEKFAEPEVRAARQQCKALRQRIDMSIVAARAEGLRDLATKLLACESAAQKAMRKDSAADIRAGLGVAQSQLDMLEPDLAAIETSAMRKEADRVMLRMRERRQVDAKLGVAIDHWCATLTTIVDRQGQKPGVLKRLVGDYVEAADRHLPAAVALLEDMQRWLAGDVRRKEHEASITMYVDALCPRQPRDLELAVRRTREQFEDKCREVAAEHQ